MQSCKGFEYVEDVSESSAVFWLTDLFNMFSNCRATKQLPNGVESIC